MARQTRIADADYYAGNSFGYYQRTNVQDMIDNFMIAYIGGDKVLTKVPRYEVAFHMQRCVQEFSYDIFHSEKSTEFELGDTHQLILPADFVNIIAVKRTAQDGSYINLTASQRSSSPRAVVQDKDYLPLTDQNGEILYADESETIKKWEEGRKINETIRDHSDIVLNDGGNFDNYNSYQGRKYGLTPADATGVNGEYVLDRVGGVIYFDSLTKQDDLIVLDYISDGLENNSDLSKVFVPKLAEDAVYANVLYSLAKLRPSAAGAAPLYKKEAKAKMNNAKIRLMDLRPQEMKAVLRNKSKWIKH